MPFSYVISSDIGNILRLDIVCVSFKEAVSMNEIVYTTTSETHDTTKPTVLNGAYIRS